MALSIKIGGVEKVDEFDSVEMEFSLNERARAVLVAGDGYVPPRLASVVAYAKDGTTPMFGGFVLSRGIDALADGIAADRCSAECVDGGAYADVVPVSLSYDEPVDAGDVIADIAEALEDYGITHTPVSTGVMLEPFSWVAKIAAEGLREVCEKANLGWRVKPDLELVTFVPGAVSAPFSITDADLKCSAIRIRDGARPPANRVLLICGPTGPLTTTQRWTANGSDTEWEVDIPAVPGGWQQGYVLEDGAIHRTVSGPGGGGYYEWDDVDGRGKISVGAGSTPSNGTVLEFIYTGQYPFRVTATSGADPAIWYVEARPDVTDFAAGQQLAAAVLDQAAADVRELEIETDEDGLEPGQALTVNTALRGGIVGTFLIQSVDVTWAVGDQHWLYRVTAYESASFQRSPNDLWRQKTGGVGGGAGVVTVAGGGSSGGATVLASPVFLGGLREASVPMGGTPSWTPVLNYVPFYAAGSFSARVRVELRARDSGVEVTARLYNVTDAVSAGESDPVTATTFNEETFVVAIQAGKAYRLEVITDTANKGCYAIGQLEAA